MLNAEARKQIEETVTQYISDSLKGELATDLASELEKEDEGDWPGIIECWVKDNTGVETYNYCQQPFAKSEGLKKPIS